MGVKLGAVHGSRSFQVEFQNSMRKRMPDKLPPFPFLFLHNHTAHNFKVTVELITIDTH